jgi:hypothetical protein
VFQMDSLGSEDGEDRLSKLAHHRRIHGHWKYSAGYVGQKPKEHLHGAPIRKNFNMTTFRIQASKSLGYEWDSLRASDATEWHNSLQIPAPKHL